MTSLAENLERVRSAIGTAATRTGRKPEEIELVAVSKTHPPEMVAEAMAAGQLVFGESRVQEARAKIPAVSGRARWHFIGHLQRNKLRHAMALGFELYHGIDSVEVARDLDRVAREAGTFPRILLEVNLAGEASKFGFSPSALRAQLEALLALDRLEIVGLMGIAPLAAESEASRPHFAALRKLRDEIEREDRLPLPQLSMGMSGDYIVGVEEGATIVRVGSAIFGARQGKAWKPAGGGATFED